MSTANWAAKQALLTAATTTSAAPSGATAGVEIRPGTEVAYIFVRGLATGGTPSLTLRLWGFDPATADWYPLSIGTGTGSSNTQGVMNGGVPIEAYTTNTVRHFEPVVIKSFKRLYLQVVAIAGTEMAASADAVWVPTRGDN